MSPRNSKRSRLAKTPAPSDPGVGEAPTTAIDRGRSMRSIAERDDAEAGSAIAFVSAEPGSEALVIEELLEPFGAAVFGVEETRLGALGHQIFVRHFPRHALHVTHRRL